MRVDWQLVARNIVDACPVRGMVAQVCRECGMSDAWLRNFRNNNHNTPNFDAGIKLLRVHLRMCGRDKHKEVIKK